MRRCLRSRTPARFGPPLLCTGALLAALLLPVARAGSADPPAPAPVTGCTPLPGPAPDSPPHPIARTGVNLSNEQLAAAAAPGAVPVCVLVDPRGIVREARLLRGGSPFDSAAVASARWWLFEPARHKGKPLPATLAISVEIPSLEDVESLAPDVYALALDAEARGDLRGAIDGWTGVLARVGAHPALGDEWSVRDRILALAARISPRPVVPLNQDGRARGARNMMQRYIARTYNEDYARTLDQVLLAVPWFVDAYRWRAAACAASGRRLDAIRDVLCYQRAVPDSASRALAERALQALAAGDTLSANSLLKN